MAVKKVKDSVVEDHIKDTAKAVEKNGLDNGKDVDWEATKGEVTSDVHLEDDTGQGAAVIVRSFDFKANPEAFRHHTPSKQELFSAHEKQIEVLLWQDGMQPMPDVTPKVMLSKNRKNYRIVVGAEPAKGHLLTQNPQTLSQITNGIPSGN